MADIFVSYARQDRARVESLVRALKEAGWSVFWDPTITPGEQWDNLIETELKQASCVLVVWSPQSISREWVRIEANYGRTRGILLPVMIERCEPPITFAHIQAEDLSESALDAGCPSFQRLCQGLRRIAGDPAPTILDAGGEGASAGAGEDPNRGSDLRYDLEISLETAFAGKTVDVSYRRLQACQACAGAGCGQCGGEGRVEREQTVKVKIPAGVQEGNRIRLAEQGDADLRGGAPGDLYIFVAVRAHPVFQPEGADLFARTPISLGMAALGGEVTLKTIEGSLVRVKTPAGSRTGRQLRLRGHGMPLLNSQERGDLYLQLEIEVPQSLTPRQVELLEAFESEAGEGAYPEVAAFRRANQA